MDLVLGALAWIEGNPVIGVAILAASGFVIVAILRYFYSRAAKNWYIGPVFYSFGKKYVVNGAIFFFRTPRRLKRRYVV